MPDLPVPPTRRLPVRPLASAGRSRNALVTEEVIDCKTFEFDDGIIGAGITIDVVTANNRKGKIDLNFMLILKKFAHVGK